MDNRNVAGKNNESSSKEKKKREEDKTTRDLYCGSAEVFARELPVIILLSIRNSQS
jgi:hypothetical protein